MPIQQCSKDGASGWQYGDSGVCYAGAGAKQQAIKQGIAILTRQGKSVDGNLDEELAQLRAQLKLAEEEDEQADSRGVHSAIPLEKEGLTEPPAVHLSDALRFYDLNEMKLDDSAGARSSWIPIFPEGKFQHPEYGELDFTRPRLEQYLRNFQNRVRKIDLCVDIDHKQEQAAGWMKRLEYQAGAQPGLYGFAEWNSLGAQLLADKRYRYISPQFGEYTDETTGVAYPNTLTCATLTNFPFLKSMPAIALSIREGALAEISQKPWAAINKAKLPRSAFLIPGDPKDKSGWKLPVYEGAGTVGPNGMYQARGPLNLNGVKAAHAAVHGARSGKSMTIPQSVHDRLHSWLSQHITEKEGGLSARQRSAEEIEQLSSLSDSDSRRYYLMADKPNPNDDEDMKDLDDAEDASQESPGEAGLPADGKKAKKAKKAKRASMPMDGDEEAGEPSDAKAPEAKASDPAMRALAESYATENRTLKDQVQALQLAERKREVKDQIRQLSEGRKRFAKPVIDDFEKLALADSKAGDKAFALLKQVQESGLVELSVRGRNSDPEDDANDPLSVDDKVLKDEKTGLTMVGSGLVKRAERIAKEQHLDWDKLADREKAFQLAQSDPAAGRESGVKRD